MASDIEIAAQQKAEYEAAWTKADVPKLYWRMKLTDLGLVGNDLRDYLQKREYRNDRTVGIGVYLHGHHKDRAAALPVLAKELVMLKDRVQYVTMRKLVYVVNQGGEDYDILLRTFALCVGQFYDDTIACPYSGFDLSNVEDFLRRRMENVQRVYLSSTSPMRDAVWYSGEFRDLVTDCTREFNFGD